MMYNNNFVVVIKANGKVLRESGGTVRLPFGSEYSILLKNLDSRKAVASITVDGEDVLNLHRVIVPAYKSVELEGKLLGSKVTHKFKFIERTEEISNFRGNKVEDGLIRVEYWFERRQEEPLYYHPYNNDIRIKYNSSPCSGVNNVFYNSVPVFGDGGMLRDTIISTTVTSVKKCRSVDDIGITVQGSKTNQNFVDGYTNALESYSSVIVLQLKGYTKKGKVVHAMTIKTRLQCPTCGRQSKSHAKWCHNCGTNLE